MSQSAPPNRNTQQPSNGPAPSTGTPARHHPDILIAGAGIIGLSLALELDRRGARVTVLEAGRSLRQASTAAAGMLAVDDPHNPPALLPFSQFSLSLYPAFLRRIASLSGVAVPFQTETTIQYLPGGHTMRLGEHSLDPRQLAAALLAAVRATGIDLRDHIQVQLVTPDPHGASICTANDEPISPKLIVFATGAWTGLDSVINTPTDTSSTLFQSTRQPPITPRKGQMLRVALPAAMRGLREVHRSEHIYIVPRTQGPQSGSALIGATVEDAGFDTTTDTASLAQLRARAAELLPALGDEEAAPELEAWAGLRSATPDHLPVLGRFNGSSQIPAIFVAAGHFRNGILLAPATAVLLADLIENKPVPVNLRPFSPDRFLHPVDARGRQKWTAAQPA